MHHALLAPLLCTTVIAAAPAETGPGKDPAVPTVLILPIEPKSDANPELAAVMTTLVATEVGKLGALRAVTLKELEGTFAREQTMALAGCDTSSCAAEIARALAADEIVMGSLGVVGEKLVLVLSRVQARDATVAGRVTRTYPKGNQQAVLDSAPLVVAELYPQQALAARKKAEADEKRDGPAVASIALGTAGAGALVVAVVAVLAAVGLGGTSAGIGVYDYSQGGRYGRRAVLPIVAVASNAAFTSAVVATVLALLSVATAALSLTLAFVLR